VFEKSASNDLNKLTIQTKNNMRTNIIGTLLLTATIAFLTGCGAVPVRHVPKIGAIKGNKMVDLHGSQPLDLKGGECSSQETNIGSVGLGKVVGNMAEWTAVTVEAARQNFSSRGATITPGAPKVLTISMTKAQVSAIPVIGISTGKIVLTATTPEGLSSTFEGSSSSLAPLSAVDGAVAEAITKLLKDSAVNDYVRR